MEYVWLVRRKSLSVSVGWEMVYPLITMRSIRVSSEYDNILVRYYLVVCYITFSNPICAGHM